MSAPQIIRTPSGEELVVLSRAAPRSRQRMPHHLGIFIGIQRRGSVPAPRKYHLP
jgi:hypothetical protein